ncbi:MAG: hypothetical protein L0322_22080 [Chloroflexi bacterium]|nr:hypothetical protein [Chloroflexota bacterium]MCI0577386.1 hypothetical protein [Chloroflexota bacterium]MCI0647073.1 hypothetical protein [Chloroflexota bacterium]
MWRHGDVLIAPIEALPPAAQKRPTLILAQGELTGHSHRIAEPGAAALWKHQEDLFLEIVASSATVIHEEHAPIVLPHGLYRVWQQREYTPQVVRPVKD